MNTSVQDRFLKYRKWKSWTDGWNRLPEHLIDLPWQSQASSFLTGIGTKWSSSNASRTCIHAIMIMGTLAELSENALNLKKSRIISLRNQRLKLFETYTTKKILKATVFKEFARVGETRATSQKIRNSKTINQVFYWYIRTLKSSSMR